jgi:hypothetical protein
MKTGGQPDVPNQCLDLTQSLLHVDKWVDGTTYGI